MCDEMNYDGFWRAIVYSGVFCLLVVWLPVLCLVMYYEAYYIFAIVLAFWFVAIYWFIKEEGKKYENTHR